MADLILTVLQANGDTLDWDYLRRGAAELKLAEELEEIREGM